MIDDSREFLGLCGLEFNSQVQIIVMIVTFFETSANLLSSLNNKT